MRERVTRAWVGDPWWSAAVTLLALGVLGQGLRAVLDGWIASGDDGYWALMARSVFSSHPPLLGSSSSGGVTAGSGYHHLGPLGFYLLAPFVALLGGVGLAVGSAVVNAAAAVTAAAAVRRGLGWRAGWVALVGSAALGLAMGSELLVDPWNPHLATLPFWCAMACALAVLAGRTWWAAPGVLAASLSLQTHLSFVPLSALTGVALLGGALYWGARDHADERDDREDGRADDRSGVCADARSAGLRPLWLALVVAVVANLPVLIQQFFGAGPGNLTRALSGSSSQEEPIGRLAGLRVVSQPFDPSNWLPGSWSPQVVRIAELASPVLSLGALAVQVVLVVVAWVLGERRVAVRAAFVAAALGAAMWIAGGLGLRVFGAPMTLARWSWPLVLVWLVVAVDGVGRLRRARAGWAERDGSQPTTPPRVRLVWGVAGLVAVLALLVANIAARDEGSGAKPAYRAPIARMLDEVGPELERSGRPHFEFTQQTLAAEATVALMDWLDERGVPFTLDDPVALRQAGEQHRSDGTASVVVQVRGGVQALGPSPEGFRTIHRVVPVSDEELAWYEATAADTRARLEAFLARLDADPDLAARVDRAPGPALDIEVYGWAPILCGRDRELPLGSAEVQREVVDDETRERLCEVDERIFTGALAVDVGPPPVG